MKSLSLGVAASMLLFAACTETPVTPDNPPSSSMTYKQGARYEYQSYNTDATTQAKDPSSERTRTWTLVNSSASVQGRTGVAVYIDSVFNGGLFSLTDSVLLHQQSGTNDVYRYGSLLGELDIATQIPLLGGLDLGRKWNHEVRLNSTSGTWLVGELADTVASPLDIPGVQGIKVAISDSAVASASENVTIGGTSYATTKSTHRIKLAVSAIVGVGPIVTAIEAGSVTITRTIWIAPALGAVVREEREGKVLNLAAGGQSSPPIPIPGYVSVMTKVIAAGG